VHPRNNSEASAGQRGQGSSAVYADGRTQEVDRYTSAAGRLGQAGAGQHGQSSSAVYADGRIQEVDRYSSAAGRWGQSRASQHGQSSSAVYADGRIQEVDRYSSAAGRLGQAGAGQHGQSSTTPCAARPAFPSVLSPYLQPSHEQVQEWRGEAGDDPRQQGSGQQQRRFDRERESEPRQEWKHWDNEPSPRLAAVDATPTVSSAAAGLQLEDLTPEQLLHLRRALQQFRQEGLPVASADSAPGQEQEQHSYRDGGDVPGAASSSESSKVTPPQQAPRAAADRRRTVRRPAVPSTAAASDQAGSVSSGTNAPRTHQYYIRTNPGRKGGRVEGEKGDEPGRTEEDGKR
jgi:hypothetical protein